MPSETELRLFRDSLSTPWGFRLLGGKDLNAQLTVQRVTPGTPCDGELQSGDVILQIQGADAARLTHLQAQDHIRRAGGSLLLRIIRYGGQLRTAPALPAVYVAPQRPPAPQWQKPHPQEYGIDYTRLQGKSPLPAVVGPPSQSGFMLSRVKDSLSGVEAYPAYQTRGMDDTITWLNPSPSLYQPSIPAAPQARPSEQPAWAGSLRSSDEDKQLGYYPHTPKVQTVHYTSGGTPEYRQHGPTKEHHSETVHAAHLQYNSPLGLYSKASAKEALDAQTQGTPGEGTIKILSESEAPPQHGFGGGDSADIGQSDF